VEKRKIGGGESPCAIACDTINSIQVGNFWGKGKKGGTKEKETHAQ